MRIHFIAIGGTVMHNLAIALHKKGYAVTGSDDEIFEPSRTRLEQYGLLPEKPGWHPCKIDRSIDTVILGMHARADNPELVRAQELGIKITSFPEYLYNQTKEKKRIVIAGSHGKTTITAMIMHVLQYNGIKFDYMAGSALKGFETMVGLSDDSEIAVFEGDEYLTSAIDPRPKFVHYKPDIAVLNGISWDHMNIYKTEEAYKDSFRALISAINPSGSLLYFKDDPVVAAIVSEARSDIQKIPYNVHGYFVNRLGFFGATHNRMVPLKFFGEHNMQNLSAAREACLRAGLTEDMFYEAIPSFEGAAGRLQVIRESGKNILFSDFAHAPSKVKATIGAVAERYPDRKIVACLELHTYSSLNIAFLPQYRDTMSKASSAFVYFSPHAVELKRLSPLNPEAVADAFGSNVKVFSDASLLFSEMKKLKEDGTIYLLMSSGNFDGYDLNRLAGELV